jgi:L-amino acid N-acyltransferase YncA
MPSPASAARNEPMTGAHAAAVLAIYQAGIEEGNATFETCAPGWAAFVTCWFSSGQARFCQGRTAGRGR